jgi:hypothetical protein
MLSVQVFTYVIAESKVILESMINDYTHESMFEGDKFYHPSRHQFSYQGVLI